MVSDLEKFLAQGAARKSAGTKMMSSHGGAQGQNSPMPMAVSHEPVTPKPNDWRETDYGFRVRDAVTPDTGKPTFQREDGALWYGPEQGNTGNPGWFNAAGQEVTEPKTDVKGMLGGLVRGGGPYAAAALAGGAAGALGGPTSPVTVPAGAALGAAAYGLSELAADPIVGLVNKTFGTNWQAPSEALQDLFTRMGVPKPDTEAERILEATSRAVGGASGGIGMGKTLMQFGATPIVQGAGQALATEPVAQIAGAAGSGAASQFAAERGAGPVGQLAAGMAGGLAGSMAASPRAFVAPKQAQAQAMREAEQPGAIQPVRVAAPEPAPIPTAPAMTQAEMVSTAKTASSGGLGSTSATARLAGQAAPNPKTVAAAERLGIASYLQPDHVTTNQSFRELSQALKSIPGSVARAGEIQGLRSVGERADRLIWELGGTNDLSRLSDGVKNRMQSTVDRLKKAADEAYSAVNEQVPPQTRGPATNALEFVRQRAEDLDGAQNLSKLERSILDTLSPSDKGEPTYALIDKVRREVGAATRREGPFADADTGLADHLYGLLDRDQEAVASSMGLADLYQAAKAVVRVRKSVEADMASLFGRWVDRSLVRGLGDATQSLSKGDADKFVNLMRSIPKDMRTEVAASALSTAFGRATQNGTLNFNTFSRWYEGLLENRAAYNAFMSNLPKESRKSISDLYRVSKNIAESTAERITTGRIQAVKDEFREADTLLSNIYALAKRAAVGVPVEAATTSIGLPGAGIAAGIASALTKSRGSAIKAADELIASPEFMALARNPSPEAAKVLSSSGVFRRFADGAKLKLNGEDGTNWLINAMRTSMQPKTTEQPSAENE